MMRRSIRLLDANGRVTPELEAAVQYKVQCQILLDSAMVALDALGFDDERAFTRKGNSIKVKAPADLIRAELSDAYVVTANSAKSCTVTVRP